jgi:hypothetical protein
VNGTTAKCPACGYPAVRDGRTTCPECGLDFDPTRLPHRRRPIAVWLLYTVASALVTTIGYSIVALTVIRDIEDLFVAQVFGAVLISIFQAIVLCTTVLRPGLTAERFIVVLATHIGLMIVLIPLVQALVFVFVLAAWAMGW